MFPRLTPWTKFLRPCRGWEADGLDHYQPGCALAPQEGSHYPRPMSATAALLDDGEISDEELTAAFARMFALLDEAEGASFALPHERVLP